MKRLLTLTILAGLLGALLPAAAVAAQSGDPCADALNGIVPDGYTLVYAPESGWSGSQVIVGTDDGDYLDGSSGDDILCGFGGNDVLEAGSGNDYLDAGTGSNELYAGSGNDTLIGIEGDVFDEGSGNDQVIANPAEPELTNCELIRSYIYPDNMPDLSGRDFTGCDLTSMNPLRGVNLSYSNLSSVNLTNSGMRGGTAQYANFSNALVESYSFLEMDMTGASFSGAVLSHATLWHNLTYVNFTNATIEFSTFLVADLTGADFTGATFHDVEWTDTTCPDGTFSRDNGDTCIGHLFP
jgi:hypothetical protein